MNVFQIISGKSKEKTLEGLCQEAGVNPSHIKTMIEQGCSDFISACVMAKFIELRHKSSFYELSHEQQLMACVNLFNEFVGDFIEKK